MSTDVTISTTATPPGLPGQDMMAQMFAAQQAFNLRVGVDTRDMSDEDQVKWLLQFSRAASQEMAELIDSVPWKWWAKYQAFDKQNARVEIVDLFHFLISMAQVMGMTAEDVHRMYMEKSRVNHARQDAGYTEKRDDARHIELEAQK